MKVLYVNHTSHVSGGERSLLDLIAGLPPWIEPVAACPEGRLADLLRVLNVEVHTIPGTDGSLKLHAWHTPRGVVLMARAALRVGRIARAVGADVVHANSIRSGLIHAPLSHRGTPPSITHVRDCLPPGRCAALALRVIDRTSTVVVSNSRHTQASLGPSSRPSLRMVVSNPVDLSRFDPTSVDPGAARASLGLEPGAVGLGVVAQLTPWKGQDDAIRIVAGLRKRGIDGRLLLAGSAKFVSGATRHDNVSYVRRLEALLDELDVRGAVTFLGEREDIPTLMSGLDMLLVPSWEEPFGRVILEGMAMGVPVAATSLGGPSEIVTPERDGLLLPPRRPDAWVPELEAVIRDPKRRASLSAGGRRRATDFSRERHVGAILHAYHVASAGGCARARGAHAHAGH